MKKVLVVFMVAASLVAILSFSSKNSAGQGQKAEVTVIEGDLHQASL